ASRPSSYATATSCYSMLYNKDTGFSQVAEPNYANRPRRPLHVKYERSWASKCALNACCGSSKTSLNLQKYCTTNSASTFWFPFPTMLTSTTLARASSKPTLMQVQNSSSNGTLSINLPPPPSIPHSFRKPSNHFPKSLSISCMLMDDPVLSMYIQVATDSLCASATSPRG